MQIIALAKEKAKGARFPALRTLPGASEVLDGGLPAGLGGEVRAQAEELAALDPANAHSAMKIGKEATVAELQAMVSILQGNTPRVKPRIDLDELDFPTPPPRN
ncbi:MAG: hypothetical protein AAF830_15470 [Pseudomonadota bacterium]